VNAVWLERLAIAIASLLLSVGLIILLSGYFTRHDQAGVSGPQERIGVAFPDLGNAILQPGDPHPLYNSIPPTSGAHLPEPVERDATALSDDQILGALAAGNVVLLYGTRRPAAALTALARSVAGPFTPALAAAGQAVILGRRPGTDGVTALAWTRLLHTPDATDPRLRQFAQAWLGRGAPRPAASARQ
jgi:hypothetical protein